MNYLLFACPPAIVDVSSDIGGSQSMQSDGREVKEQLVVWGRVYGLWTRSVNGRG